MQNNMTTIDCSNEKHQLLSENQKNQIRSWLKDKAQYIWDEILNNGVDFRIGHCRITIRRDISSC